MPEEPPRRLPGGAVPRRPASQPRPASQRRPESPPRPAPAPFDPRERPLGMIRETWAPVEEPVILGEEEPEHRPGAGGSRDAGRHAHRAGPALTVWIIILLVAVVVVLAVVSYRRAPP